MGLTITPTEASLGAVVTGVRLETLDDPTWAALEEAFLEYAVLLFPGQHLDPAAQAVFAERFGEIEPLTPNPELKTAPLTNMRHGGRLADPEEEPSQVLRGNEEWHTDSSYMPLAARASVLSAHVVPPSGGQTEWADMRAAYDALDAATRERVADLSAYHSYYRSQASIGHRAQPGSGYGFHEDGSPLRPLVKRHPVTGRRALYVGRHAFGIPGLEPDESKRLLSDLVNFACQPPRLYSHEWQPGDLAVWDNRSLLHRARPYDTNEPRMMMHTRVAGDPRTEWAQPHPELR